MGEYLLSSFILVPLLLMVLAWIPGLGQKWLWGFSLIGSLWILIASLSLLLGSDAEVHYTYLPWFSLELGSVGRIQFDYFLLADGLSGPMLLLSGITLVVASLASRRVNKYPKAYFSLFLLLAASISGSFLAADFLLFFLFFEFMLLPMYFLIGIWGGPRRTYAAIKFFIYTLVGSLLILVVLVAMYGQTVHVPATAGNLGFGMEETLVLLDSGDESLSGNQVYGVHLVDLPELGIATFVQKAGGIFDPEAEGTWKGRPYRYWAFLLLLLGFLIKLPAVPVHTWLPDAHVEASTPISVILAAVLLKLGAYGLFRIVYPAFPDAAVHYVAVVGFLGVLSIWFGALNALAQNDLKKLVAYSSVSHMGFVLLGLASGTMEGFSGAYYQLFSHGLISALLFLVVGVLYDRVHDRQISNFSGLNKMMPAYGFMAGLAFFASLGLPGFSGFIAEILVLVGAFSSGMDAGGLPFWMPVAGALGLVLAAAYSLWAYQRVWMGSFFLRKEEWRHLLPDLTLREKLMLYPLGALAFFFGIWPAWLLDKLAPVLGQLQKQLVEFYTLIP